MIEHVKQAAAPTQQHKPGGAGIPSGAQANAGFDAALLLALLPDGSGDPVANFDTDAGASQEGGGSSALEGDAAAGAAEAPDLAQDSGPATAGPGPNGSLPSDALAQVLMALRGATAPGPTPDTTAAVHPGEKAEHAVAITTDGRPDTLLGKAAGASTASASAAGADPVNAGDVGARSAPTDEAPAQPGRTGIGGPADAGRAPPAGASSEHTTGGDAARAAHTTTAKTTPVATADADRARHPRGEPTAASAGPATAPASADRDRQPDARTLPTGPATGTAPGASRIDQVPTARTEAAAAIAGVESKDAPDLPGGASVRARSPKAAAAPQGAGGSGHRGVDPSARPGDAAPFGTVTAPAPNDSADPASAARDAATDAAMAGAGRMSEARPGTGTQRAPRAAPSVATSAQTDALRADALEKALAPPPGAHAEGEPLDFGGQSPGQGAQGPMPIIAAGMAHAGALQGASPMQAPPGTAPAQFTLPVPLDAPEFHTAFAGRIESLALQGLQSAEIVVTPRDMGPIRVELSMSEKSLSVAFSAAHPETSRAIEQSLATLRTMLSEHGITLSQASVGSGAFGQPQERGAARSTSSLFRHRDGAALGQVGSTLDDAPAPTPRSRGPGTIDLFA